MAASGSDDRTDTAREARLAEALRANLRRRKAQARARSGEGRDKAAAPAKGDAAEQGDNDAG